MKKIITLAAFAAVALTGCNTPNHIEGTLAVSAPLNVNAQYWGKLKKMTVAKGTYNTSLALQDTNAEIRIHTKDVEVIFTVPNVKADMLGNVNMSAASLGQEFGLQGKIFDSTEGIDRVVGESCIHHYETQYVCHDENCCDKNGQNCHTEQKCGNEQVPVYGTEDVREQGDQTTKNATMSLVKAGSTIGRYNGGYTYSENIRSREVVGACRL